MRGGAAFIYPVKFSNLASMLYSGYFLLMLQVKALTVNGRFHDSKEFHKFMVQDVQRQQMA